MIDLAERHLSEVRLILRTRVPGLEVRAFGSRVEGTAQRFSDLDLALVGEEPLDWRTIEELKDAFADSDLPFLVDVIDWRAAPRSFRESIGEHYERLQ
ncbi:MAG: nucleotidyltransferase domain-containing protein [Thermodesulfobacteriota bacterium]